MFVPAEMSEVDIFVLEGDVEPVAQTIAEMGIMHLLDVNTLGEWAEDVGTEWTGRISAYATQARRVATGQRQPSKLDDHVRGGCRWLADADHAACTEGVDDRRGARIWA